MNKHTLQLPLNLGHYEDGLLSGVNVIRDSRGRDIWSLIGVSEPNAAFILRACNSHEALLEACKAVDIYFKALFEKWRANDGRVVSSEGVVVEGGQDVERLCNVAGMKIEQALALTEGWK